jgi:hypothetical protein
LTFVATNKKGTPKLVACNRIRKQTQKQKHLTQPFSKDTHALKIIQAPTQPGKQTQEQFMLPLPNAKSMPPLPNTCSSALAQHLFKPIYCHPCHSSLFVLGLFFGFF